MSHVDQLKRLVVERELAIDDFDYTPFDTWASAELAADDPHPLAYDLFDRDCDVFATLKRIANERHGFQLCSPDGDAIVGQIAREYLNRFIERKIMPLQLCGFVAQMDAHYIDRVPHDYPIPDWVSTLYNSCDWCDDSWTHGNMPHLVEDVQAALQELSQP